MSKVTMSDSPGDAGDAAEALYDLCEHFDYYCVMDTTVTFRPAKGEAMSFDPSDEQYRIEQTSAGYKIKTVTETIAVWEHRSMAEYVSTDSRAIIAEAEVETDV